MASKKKADEEPVIAQEAPETAQEAQEAVQDAPEVQEGADVEDSALAGVEGELAAVRAPGGLNLREGPSVRYRVLEPLPDGTLLMALELPYGAQVPGWALVHTGARVGWVDTRFIQALEPEVEA
jgi:hypothetical protein